MSDKVTCGCKHWPYTYRPEAPPVFVDGTRFPEERAQWVRFCPEGTEALGEGYCSRCGALLNGDGTMDPRHSDEYVRLLEEYVRRGKLPGDAPMPCWYASGGYSDDGGRCDHEDPPIGCLRALATEREKEK